MSNPIERIYLLKTEAAKRGLYDPLRGRHQLVLHAGQNFVDDLLTDATLRWRGAAQIKRDEITVFGIKVIPKDAGISANGVRLVFELDG